VSIPTSPELILGTHGNLYKHLSGGMSRYPIPDFPLPRGSSELLLDIGCNWGRWVDRGGAERLPADRRRPVVRGDRRGETHRATARRGDALRRRDARRLPFADDTFDVVFSYGVLQHFSKSDVATSVDEIARVVKRSGYSWVQMPNSLGALNAVRLAQRRFREGDAFEVRYWKPSELKRVFGRIGPDRAAHGRLLHAQPAEARPRPAASSLSRSGARVGGAEARARADDARGQRERALRPPLTVVELVCPRDRSALRDGVCEQGHEYPLVDGVPVLLSTTRRPRTRRAGASRSSRRRRRRASTRSCRR
jgi:uncharacterized protein YbaR (Trm112 family)